MHKVGYFVIYHILKKRKGLISHVPVVTKKYSSIYFCAFSNREFSGWHISHGSGWGFDALMIMLWETWGLRFNFYYYKIFFISKTIFNKQEV